MALNKLIVNGEVKFDISDSTVTPKNLFKDVIAYNKLGERIVGEATGGSNNPFDEYLREPVSTDIDHATNTIVSIMDEGTVTTTFGKENDSKIITSKIVPNSGDVNYIRKTTITDIDQVTQIRETLEEENKS